MGSLLPVQTGLVSSPLHTFTRTFMCARVHMHTPPVRAHRYMHAHSQSCAHMHVEMHTHSCAYMFTCVALAHALTTPTCTLTSTHAHTCPCTAWWTLISRGPWAPPAALYRCSKESGP